MKELERESKKKKPPTVKRPVAKQPTIKAAPVSEKVPTIKKGATLEGVMGKALPSPVPAASGSTTGSPGPQRPVPPARDRSASNSPLPTPTSKLTRPPPKTMKSGEIEVTKPTQLNSTPNFASPKTPAPKVAASTSSRKFWPLNYINILNIVLLAFFLRD